MTAPAHTPQTHPFTAYSREVLRFELKTEAAPDAPAHDCPPSAALDRRLSACLQAWEQDSPPVFLLLGLGSGAFLQRLDAELPAHATIIVSELDPATARRVHLPTAHDRTILLADTSPWAHFLLWAHHGLTPQGVCIRINPELTDRSPYTPLFKAFTQARPLPSTKGTRTPTIGLSAILSPADPGLDQFFAQLPAWLSEAVVLWDAETPPAPPSPCAVNVMNLARPLHGDFAAQRNAALTPCTADWVISLDADERLSEPAWAALPRLGAAADAANLAALYLPRLTPVPGGTHALAGYGLWPDLQLRFFRRAPGLAYKRPVHERLTGVTGAAGLAVDLPILHLNRVLKNDGKLREKLAGFDRAANGLVTHRLNKELPLLPLSFFPELSQGQDAQVHILPGHPD